MNLLDWLAVLQELNILPQASLNKDDVTLQIAARRAFSCSIQMVPDAEVEPVNGFTLSLEEDLMEALVRFGSTLVLPTSAEVAEHHHSVTSEGLLHYLAHLQEDGEYTGPNWIGEAADTFESFPPKRRVEKEGAGDGEEDKDQGKQSGEKTDSNVSAMEVEEQIAAQEDNLAMRSMFFMAIVAERIKDLNAIAAKMHKKKSNKPKKKV